VFPNANHIIHESAPEIRGEPKTVYSGGFNSHEEICQQRRERWPLSQTKSLFVKLTSKTKIKRIIVCKDNQLHNDFNPQTSHGHILYQIKLLLLFVRIIFCGKNSPWGNFSLKQLYSGGGRFTKRIIQGERFPG